MEESNKKVIALVAFAAIIVLSLGLYVLLRGRVTPPSTTPLAIPGSPERAVTQEDKMKVLQQLSATPVSAAERKNILHMLAR